MQWQPTMQQSAVPANTVYAEALLPTQGTIASSPAARLFGVIVPGCPVQTNLTQVDNGRWSLALGYAPESFVVFLTMVEPLPSGYGIGLFLAREDTMSFQYMGALAQQRPSTILKVPTTFLNSAQPIRVVLGLALEREEELVNLGTTQEQPMQQIQAATKMAVAERLLEDLYGFVASYARSINWRGNGAAAAVAAPNSGYAPARTAAGLEDVAPGDYVVLPMSFVEKWRTRLQTKIQKDNTFWQ